MLYAIVENGGKQYKVVEGSYIELDLLPEEIGKKKTFDKVLLLADDGKVQIGTPYLTSVSVDTTVMEHFKGPKIIVFKYRAKQRYRVKTGHRQLYTRIIVDSIAFSGKAAKAESAKEEKAVEKKPKAVKKTTTAAKKTTVKATTAKKPAAKKPAAKKPAASTKKTTTVAKKTAAKTSAAKKPAAKSKTSSEKTTTKKKTDEK